MAKFTGKEQIIGELRRRVSEKILEQSNFDLLEKLIKKADSLDEAIQIAELGTTYKRTGFHFDKRLEKTTDTISYFEKNRALSFETDKNAVNHKLIIGDNYPALLNLLIEYRGKIDVIYIDPPYGKDYMGEFAETNYNNAITRDNILSMLYPRLWLAKRLLSDSGVIFCSIDDKNHAYVKGLFDEIFEERNFIASIVWERAYSPVNLKKHFSLSHDYMLCYAKSYDDAVCFGLKRSDEANERYSNPDNDERGRWKSSDMSVGPAIAENIYEITLPNGRKVLPPSGRSWVFARDKYDEMVKDNRIWFGANGDSVPSVKRLLSEVKQGMTPMTVWKYTEVGHSQEATKALKEVFDGESLFDYPKPVELLKRAIGLYSCEDSIVLDFFAGSGTTGQSVLELNKEKKDGQRKYICVQLDENLDEALKTASKSQIQMIKEQISFCDKYNRPHLLSEITADRLLRVMTGKDFAGKDIEWAKKNKPLGGNLDVYNIGTVASFETADGKTPFDVIDETLYGKEKFNTVKEKVEWVCDNFEITQRKLEE